MKKSILLLATVAVLVPFLPVATHAATEVYDLNDQWSSDLNPNGTWSYRGGTNLLQADGYGSWVGDLVSMSKQDGSVTVFFRCCGNDIVNILWTAPNSGTIDISGAVWDGAASECVVGGSSFWAPSHNGNSLTGAQFPCGVYYSWFPFYFSLGFGGNGALQSIPVTAGDQVVLELRNGPFGPAVTSMGVNVTITLTPDSGDASAAIEQLAQTVVTMNLQNGIENSLDSKLDAALNVLVDVNVNNDGAACNSLAAFINAVEAQRSKKITSAEADQLIASAEQIRGLLNCGN